MVNNIIDNSLPFELFTTAILMSGILFAVFDYDQLKNSANNYAALGIFGMIYFRLFLHIQKQVHKEVFIEMKKRTSEQEEFKTIFNELDEGILITEQNRITKFNKVFQKLISKYFDKTIVNKVRALSDM